MGLAIGLVLAAAVSVCIKIDKGLKAEEKNSENSQKIDEPPV